MDGYDSVSLIIPYTLERFAAYNCRILPMSSYGVEVSSFELKALISDRTTVICLTILSSRVSTGKSTNSDME
jgi:hypothetical protein